MKKASDCQQCKQHRFKELELVCIKGHKPRFYIGEPYDTGPAWKRRCDDFDQVGPEDNPWIRDMQNEHFERLFGGKR